MARTKKPKVQIKRQKTSLGWAYRIYIDGMYMGTGLTRASARTGAQRMLAINERVKRAISPQKSMTMAANNDKNEITNATPKSVVHISTPQWPRPCHRERGLGHWVELGGAYGVPNPKSGSGLKPKRYTANFSSGSQHFTSQRKSLSASDLCHSTCVTVSASVGFARARKKFGCEIRWAGVVTPLNFPPIPQRRRFF